MNELTPLERQVMELLFDDERTRELRKQLDYLRCVERDETGKGIISTFGWLEGVTPSKRFINEEFHDVVGSSPLLENGIGFVVFVRDGLISWFEAFAYGEAWPPDETTIDVRKQIIPVLKRPVH